MKRLLLVVPALIGVLLGFLVARPRTGATASAAPHHPGRFRYLRMHPALAIVVVLAVAVGTVGGTYAAWSDFQIIAGNRVGAGTLIIAGDDQLDIELTEPGDTDTASLEVTTTGTTPAQLGLSLVPDHRSGGLCDAYDPAVHGGELLLFLDGTDEHGNTITEPVGDLCGADLTDLAWPGIDLLVPGALEQVAIHLRVELVSDPVFRWSGKQATFDLEVTGDQPGGGFSDFTTGTLTVTVGAYAPERTLPAGCPGELGDYRSWWEPKGNEELDLLALDAAGPAVVIAGNGTQTITGTDEGDCIIVGNGNKTVYGMAGDDTIVSEHPGGRAAGGGKAQFYGGPGDDTLIAREGAALLDGGTGTNTCEGPPGTTTRNCQLGSATRTADPAPPGRSTTEGSPLESSPIEDAGVDLSPDDETVPPGDGSNDEPDPTEPSAPTDGATAPSGPDAVDDPEVADEPPSGEPARVDGEEPLSPKTSTSTAPPSTHPDDG